MFSSDSSCLSSRGKVIKWFWDSAEEGYRTYHMDQYDEDKNPSVSEAPRAGLIGELQGGYLTFTHREASNILLSCWSSRPRTSSGF